MPNIKSQKKRVLTNNKSNEINNSKRSKVRTTLKKYNAALETADVATCEAMLKEVVSVINRACSDGIYHKNNAARKIAKASKALDAKKAAL